MDTLDKQLLSLVRQRVNREQITDRTQIHWDQLLYDSYFRGKQRNGRIDNVNGRLGFSALNLTNIDRFSDRDQAEAPPYNFNLFRRGVRQFNALFGVRPPNCFASPVNSRVRSHAYRSRIANRLMTSMQTLVNFRALQSRLSFILAKSGPAFSYTRWVSSGSAFGYTEVPTLEPTQLQLAEPFAECPDCTYAAPAVEVPSGRCPHCGALMNADEGMSIEMNMPTGETTEVQNGSLMCTLHTLSSIVIPSGFLSLKDCPWMALVEEKDRGALAAAYDIPYEDIKPFSYGGEMNDPNGPDARARLQSYDSTFYSAAMNDRATEGRYWLNPETYFGIKDAGVRRELAQNFPQGIRLTVVGGKVVNKKHENKMDVWWSCLPEEADNMTPSPYLADSVGMTDANNDAWEIAIESAGHSIPLNIIDPDILDPEDIEQHGQRFSSFVLSKERGRDPSKGIGRLSPSEFRPEMVRLAEALFATHDQMQGLLPIIWGSVAGAETAYETESARNQALAMLAIPWLQQRSMHEAIYRQGITQIALHSDGNAYLPVDVFAVPENKVEIATVEELQELLQGGWKIESDEQMPMSVGQVRSSLFNMLSGNLPPEVLQVVGIGHPINAPMIQQYMGLPGMRSPIVEAVEAVQVIQEELLREQPTMIAEGQMQSSQPLDADLYDPQLVVQIMKPWLISDKGRNEREANELGWMNVRLFVQEAEMILQQQQQQAMMQQQMAGQEGVPEGAPAPV